MRKYLLTSIVSLLVCLVLSQAEAQIAVAQEEILSDQTISDQTDSVETKFSTRDYVDMLSVPDELTGAVINVYQDSTILATIGKKVATEAQEVKGYRIQIFSSNTGAMARDRAFEIKEILVAKHPKLADEIYITYTSPFWKVRIGNCETNAKAQELRRWIIAEYPEFTTETYIVPSMIFVY